MFSVIVARDLNGGIGKNGKLPWIYKDDMKHFCKITTESIPHKTNCVIMGRKTYFSIPKSNRPLKNRLNLILSSTMKQSIDPIVVFQNITQILDYVNKNKNKIDKCFVIGGASVYDEFLSKNLITTIYETFIHDTHECDVFFRSIPANFKLETQLHKKIRDTTLTFNKYNIINVEEENYLALMKKILNEGERKNDRTTIGTVSLFAESLKYDIRDGKLPLLTTKNVPFRFIVEELLWFLDGKTDSNLLKEKKIRIWDGNTTREFLDNRGLTELPVGDIGAGYGHQLRHFGAEYKTCNDDYTDKGIDQLKYVIDLLKNEPHSRRILFSYWNPLQLKDAALPPCHLVYQFYVNTNTNEISCCLYQRSSDYFLANNYNAISAIILTHILGHICGYKPREFTHFIADTHIYLNHIEQCQEQIKRHPSVQPRLKIVGDIKTIEDFKYDNFKLINYFPQKAIRGKMN